eukprot:CAMPEP_0194138438 /NCGR_PEP_ID=MMETSP0152-20130528/8220_1 /TAXON_ID=1049557 /ORGANISM="Thalassiothrix antarctica, Strain L6-D1" /LENGTH=109 /DNA_ID=CAMNT_0038835877 /DNA_START=106 /DNA_END=435 /DNA_ORIENTATION=+
MVYGALFAGFDAFQGVPLQQAMHPTVVGRYMAGIYVYNVSTCPMEAIHGRQSLLHNFLSAGVIGFVGVSRGMLGIPFLQNYHISNPPVAAFFVYGSIASAFSALGGKRL